MGCLVRAIAVCAVLLTAYGSCSAKELSRYRVARWDVSVHGDDKIGRFSSCIAMASYRSGLDLLFMIDNKFSWYIGISGAELTFREGSAVQFYFVIDKGEIHQFQGVAFGSGNVMVPLSKNAGIFNEVRRGRVLTVGIGGKTASFNLDGTSRMLVSLLGCAENQGQPPPPVAVSPPTSPKGTQPVAASGEAAPKAGAVLTGSGFFVSSGGIGITNAHVVEGCQSGSISGYGKARVVARDVANDLALIQLTEPSITPSAKLRRKPLQLGETVFVMGFPLAGQLDNGLNFTSGLVSSLAGIGNNSRLLQFTAPIQAGNSGGPVVDGSGLIVGVTQSKLDEVAALAASGSLPQNINFGIKSDLVAIFMRANGAEPIELETQASKAATEVAREGKGYTFQIKCTSE